jgi:hypothetical protein
MDSGSFGFNGALFVVATGAATAGSLLAPHPILKSRRTYVVNRVAMLQNAAKVDVGS